MSARRSAPFLALFTAIACVTGCPGPAPVQPSTGPNGSVKAPGLGNNGGNNSKDPGTPIIPSPSAPATNAPTTPAPTASGATPGGTPTPAATATATVAPTATPSAGPTATTFQYFAADLPISQNAGAGGGAVAKLADDGKSLSLKLGVVGATGDLTGAHVRLGTSGFTGQSVHDFAIAADKRSASTTWAATGDAPLNAERLQQLKTGGLYVAIDTGLNVNGEARGQLMGYASAHVAQMDIVPGVFAPNARGVAWAVLDASNKIVVKLYTTGLTGPLDAAHVHVGGPNDGGPIAKDLVLGADKKTATVTWSTTDGTQPLTQAHLDALKLGRLYVAGHTPQNAAGEIRGQLLAP